MREVRRPLNEMSSVRNSTYWHLGQIGESRWKGHVSPSGIARRPFAGHGETSQGRTGGKYHFRELGMISGRALPR